jgi:macrolide-specific efflux system membrane fusion protein
MRPRLRRKGTLVNSVLAVALLGAAGFGTLTYLRSGNSPSAAGSSTSATAQVMDVVATVSASGTAAPRRTESASFGSDGSVSAVAVKVGDRVRKGDVLARATGSSARLSLRSARVSYENARAAYDDALDAADDSSAAVGSAYSALLQAKLALRQAQQVVDGLVLRAPIGGTVTSLGAVGDSTAGSASDDSDSSDGSGFATIAQTGAFVVTGDFSETDTAKLKVGQRARVTFNATPNRSFPAKVTSIDLTSTTSSDNVVSYGVDALLTKTPARLRAGQTATVTVTTGRANDVLAVPSAAVTASGAGATVELVTGHTTTTTDVRTGLEGDSYTEIKSGLSEGDQVEISLAGVGGDGFPTDGFPGGVVVRDGGGPSVSGPGGLQ